MKPASHPLESATDVPKGVAYVPPAHVLAGVVMFCSIPLALVTWTLGIVWECCCQTFMTGREHVKYHVEKSTTTKNGEDL